MPPEAAPIYHHATSVPRPGIRLPPTRATPPAGVRPANTPASTQAHPPGRVKPPLEADPRFPRGGSAGPTRDPVPTGLADASGQGHDQQTDARPVCYSILQCTGANALRQDLLETLQFLYGNG